MPRFLRLALPLLFCAFSAFGATDDSRQKMNVDAQVKPEKIAQELEDEIVKVAAKYLEKSGMSEADVRKKVQEELGAKILNSAKLKENSGANPEEVNKAKELVAYFPELFALKNQLKNTRDRDEKEQIRSRISDIRQTIAGLESKTGPLKDILKEVGNRPGTRRKNPSGRGVGGSGSVGNGGESGGGESGEDEAGDEADDSPMGPVLDGLISGSQNMSSGNYSDALADYKKVAEADPKSALAFSGMSSALYHQDQFSEAYADAKQALSLDPADRNALTIMKFTEGRIDGAAASAAASGGAPNGASAGGSGSGGGREFEPAASASFGLSSPDVSRASVGEAPKAARAALGMNDLGGAMTMVSRAIAQDPANPELLNLRASIYARQGDYARAAADARSGLARAPKNAALLRTLAYSQVRGKDYGGAQASANELLELNPNDPLAYALRAHAYGSMGDRDAMMADLQRAAALDPRFQQAAAQAGQVQLPSDSDILFLFPGEEAPGAKTAAPAGGRARRFGLLASTSALGGLLIALGLLRAVFAPLKERLTSAFTRMNRTGPTVGARDESGATAPGEGLLPGTIRGQYEISRQIGVGGMGMVFEGTDRSLNRRVAIKKMREELRADPRERARFVSEAKTVAALHHPNIVDIYAIAEDGEDVFLVFEYVDGKTVHELVQSSGKLEPSRAAQIVRASAEALEYAHSRGVIHRDMKPSNVMIDGAGRVKVMDFGIARMAKDAATRYSMTNTVVGTPPYMAPEQEQGQVRRESDVYALAICAYETLCGRLPFVGTGGGMLLNKINMSYVPPSREVAGLAPALDEVFARAFQADPDKRYRTPREFADAFETALASGVRA